MAGLFRWSQGFSAGSLYMKELGLPHSMAALGFLHGCSVSQAEYFMTERTGGSCIAFHGLASEGHKASYSPYSVFS